MLEGHNHWVLSIAWSPDGKWVATASEDKTGAIWDAATGQRLKVLEGYNHWVQSIACSPDGTRVATASIDEIARIYSVRISAHKS